MASGSRRGWRFFVALGCISIAVLAGILYLTSLDWNDPAERLTTPRLAVTTTTDKAIRVFGWCDNNRVISNGLVRFWFRFESLSDGKNPPRVTIQEFATPGFGLIAPQLPATLSWGPDRTARFQGQLQASRSLGRYQVVLIYSWSLDQQATHVGSLSLGPLETISSLDAKSRQTAHRVRGLARDFSLPLAGALLTAGLGIWAEARTRRKKLEEDHRARQLKREEDERNYRRNIWQTFLPQSFIDARKYYIPVASEIGSFRHALTELKAKRMTGDEAFHALALMLKQMQFLKAETGGFQFKSRAGENLVELAWHTFVEILDRHLGRNRRVTVASLTAIQEPFFRFRKHLDHPETFDSEQPVVVMRDRFLAWVADAQDPFELLVPVINILRQVLVYEVNRPFQYWYDQAEEFPVDKLNQARIDLGQIQGDRPKELASTLADYITAETKV